MQQAELTLVHKVLFAEKPKTEKPPLLLLLHGYGSHENDLFAMAPMLNARCTVVSARAPLALGWGGFAWYEINMESANRDLSSNVGQSRESMEKVRQFIGEVHEVYGTDPETVYLAGFSQGAILSYGLSLNYPYEFQKVMALSGYLLQGLVPERYKQADLQHLDFFVSHGAQDEVIPVEGARQAVQTLEQLQVSHHYREYPAGHTVHPQNFADLQEWMRERDML